VTTYDYLTVADVLAMHGVLINRHGGSLGLRGVPMEMHADIIRMFESNTFNIASIDPWLREHVIRSE